MLYTCVALGTPGTWVKQSPLVPLGPARAYDSRTSDGPLGNGTRTVSLTSSGLPAGASVALMNVTVVDTVGVGYLTLFAHGASRPNTANVNWYAASQILNNSATSQVGSTGEIDVYCFTSGSTQFTIDVFGFYY